jgi:hypothetical protein
MKLTQEQALILTGYTGIMCVKNFGDFHCDAERRLGRPIWTHQFPGLNEELRLAYREDFLAMLPGDDD